MIDSRIHLQYVGTARTNKEIWFSNLRFNGLFSVDISDFSLHYRGRIPFLDEHTRAAYAGATLVYDDKLFFFPNNCKQIMIYDIKKNSFYGISISPLDGSDVYTTVGAILWRKQVVYVIPQKPEQGSFILDLSTLKLERNIELDKLLSKTGHISRVINLDGAKIAILAENSTILEISLEERKEINRKYFGKEVDIFAIAYNKNSYWILSKTSTSIYEWDSIKNTLKEYKLLKTEWLAREGIPYANIVFIGEQIILLNYKLKYIMRIEKKTHTIQKLIDYPEGFRFLSNRYKEWAAFTAFDVIEHKVWIHPVRGNMLLIYDVERNSIEGRRLTVSTKKFPFLVDDVEQEMGKINGIFCELDDMGGLNGFMEKIEKNIQDMKSEEIIGEKIYNMIAI